MADFSAGLREAMAAAFPGSSKTVRSGQTGLLRILGARAPDDTGFCQDELEPGMLAIFACKRSEDLPIRVGKVLRLMRETGHECTVFLEPWEPILKSDAGGRLNVFGTWAPPGSALAEGARRKRSRREMAVRTIPAADVLVWPVVLDRKEGQEPADESGKLPFSALHYMRECGEADMSSKRFTFSKRGQAFYQQVVKRAAQYMRDAE